MGALFILVTLSSFAAVMAVPLPVRFRVGRHADPAYKGSW
jgi:hypothetical protein